MIIFLICVLFWLLAGLIVRWRIGFVVNFCPRVYQGYACRFLVSRDGCDHSSRAWALLGIDEELLTSQPYYWEKEAKKGYWNE